MTDTQLRIGIMICTANRPKMLENCLNSLARQEINAEWDVEICVVENDDGLHSAHEIAEVAQKCPFPIHHLLETRRGIPFARNRTLTEALERRYDWIALIDDDEVAVDGWLKAHMETVERYGADVSYGAVTKTFEKNPPEWWPAYQVPDWPAGKFLDRASTNNVLFSAKLIQPPASLTFNNLFLHGYEDLEFFESARERNFRMVWSPSAIVNEEVLASRVQPERLLDWCRSSAAAHVQVSILRKGYCRSAWKFLLKGTRRILTGSIGTAVMFLPSRLGSDVARNRLYKFRMRTVRGLGNLQGLMRISNHYYTKIDGR